MKRGTITAVAVGIASIACASRALQQATPGSPQAVVEPLEEGTKGSQIVGLVVHQRSGAPIEGALVVIQCGCLEGLQEAPTDESGLYGFRALPAGVYTLQVLYARGEVSRTFALEPQRRMRFYFRIDPEERLVRG